MRSARVFVAILPILLLSGPGPALAQKPQKASATPAKPDEDGCFRKIGVKGRPHKISTIASLSAVREWVQKALVHGEAYSMWHNAAGSRVKCQQLPRSQYYACFASGKPCAPSDKRASQ